MKYSSLHHHLAPRLLSTRTGPGEEHAEGVYNPSGKSTDTDADASRPQGRDANWSLPGLPRTEYRNILGMFSERDDAVGDQRLWFYFKKKKISWWRDLDAPECKMNLKEHFC